MKTLRCLTGILVVQEQRCSPTQSYLAHHVLCERDQPEYPVIKLPPFQTHLVTSPSREHVHTSPITALQQHLLSNCPLPSIIDSRVTNWVRKLQTALTTCEGDYLHKAQVAEIMLASCHKLSGSSHQFTVYFDACCKDTGIVNSLYIKMLIIKTQEQMWLYFPTLQNVLK